MGPTSSRGVIAGGLVVGMVAVSVSAILARVAMGDDPGVAASGPGAASALAVAFWRTALGSLALAPLGWRAHRRRGRALPAGTHRLLATSGLTLGLHFALFQGSLALTTVASAVTLATMSPIFVALGGWWWLKEPSDRRTVVGMAITVAGAVTIGIADASGHEFGTRALVGDLAAFGSAVAVTGYLLIGRVARREVPATTYSAIVYAWSAASLLVVALIAGVDLVGFDPVTWLAIGGIVLGPQLFGHTMFNALLGAVPATVVAIVVLSEPVGAGLLAWLVLDELPTGWFYVGAPLVLAGVALATVRRPRSRDAAEVTAIET